MHPYIESLYTRKREAWEQAKGLLDRADGEKRELTAEESEQWDRLNETMTNANDQIKRWEQTEAAARAADALREDVTKAIASTGHEPTDSDIVRLIKGEINEFELRAMSTAGGSAIETSFYDRLIVYERSLVPMLSVATVLNTSSGAPITFPRLTADTSAAGTVTAEAGGLTEADPTISSVNLTAFKYGAVTLWSRELDEDVIDAIALEDVLAQSIARNMSISGYGAHLTTGTGTVQPWGVVARATNGGTASGTSVGSATDTYAAPYDLVGLFYGLAVPYRNAATWMVSTTAAQAMRGFRDSNRNFIWEPGDFSNNAGVDRFLGRPVVENPAMAALGSASKSVLCGDFSRYFIRQLPLRIERSTEYKFSNDQLAIKVVKRIDGDLIDTAAIRYLVSVAV